MAQGAHDGGNGIGDRYCRIDACVMLIAEKHGAQ